jgi:hypothetical protein
MSITGSEKKGTIDEYSNSDEKSVTSETNNTDLTTVDVKLQDERQSKFNSLYNTIKHKFIKSPRQKISKNYQNRKRNKINRDISWFYWKKYVAAVFWAQLSTPVNLSITLMTALTTAQANAPDLLDAEIYKKLTIATLVLTVINTFFRPHEKSQQNKDYMKQWNAIGIEFEKVYYSKKNNVVNSYAGSDEAIDDYQAVEDKVNELRQKEGPDVTNFVIDFIHIICYFTCLKKYKVWIQMDDFETENGTWV